MPQNDAVPTILQTLEGIPTTMPTIPMVAPTPGASQVRCVLDLSTANLPKHLGQTLNAFDGVVAYRLDIPARDGWLLWVPQDPRGHDLEYGCQIPVEVLTVQIYARLLGCDYVLFDVDGPQNPDLPTWEW